MNPAFCCDICKELIQNPVALPCLHTFCSLCIRLALKSQLKCPTCYQECKGSMELKKNHFVQKMLDYLMTTDEFKTKQEETSKVESRSKRKVNTDTVDCPICAKQVLLKDINKHMDSNCKLFMKIQHEYTKKGSVPYDLYKTPQLKQMLQQDGLQTVGDRRQLIKRHSYYVELFNSNCDAKNPKSMSELQKMVTEWEKTSSGTKLVFGKGKELDQTIVNSHMKSYANEFDQLIAAVKAKRESAGSKRRKMEQGSATGLNVEPEISTDLQVIGQDAVCISDDEYQNSVESGILDIPVEDESEKSNIPNKDPPMDTLTKDSKILKEADINTTNRQSNPIILSKNTHQAYEI